MREVAWRVFSKEYNSSTYFLEGESNLSANYLVTPMGAKINRVFIVGVLTEVQNLSTGTRARVSDPTGAFSIYAGRYQSKIASFLSDLKPPEFVSVTGKANIYSKDDGEKYTNIRPESLNVVTETDRDTWNIEAARSTLERINVIEKAIKNDNLKSISDRNSSLHNLEEVIQYYSLEYEYIQKLRKSIVEIISEMAENDKAEFEKNKKEEKELENQQEKMGEERKETVLTGSGAEVKKERTGSGGSSEAKKETEMGTGTGDSENTREYNKNDEDSYDDPEKMVLEVIENEGGIKRDIVVEKAKRKGIKENEAEDALENLLLEGLCYETDEGVKSL